MGIEIDTVNATPEFRARMLAALISTDWLNRYGNVVLPEYFPSKPEQTFVSWLLDYHVRYGSTPDMIYAVQNMDVSLAELVSCEGDLRYAADQLIDFCRTQAMKIAILQSVDDIKTGNLQTPIERVTEAIKVGTDHMKLGLELVDDVNDWVYEELHAKRFPTGWRTIDHALDGGLSVGEYGLVMTPPNVGKTMMLINIGYALAGLLGAANVLHVTLEMIPQKILKRYGTRVTGAFVKRGNESAEEAQYIDMLRKRAKVQLRGRIRVINPGRRMVDIKRSIDQLAGKGFVTQALIVDYADLMLPARKRPDLRFELADIARDLRQLGEDYHCPVWSATQAGRQAFHKTGVTDMGDIAEAIEKAAVADVIISLSQTDEEEKLNTGRLYTAKVRDGGARQIVDVVVDKARQLVMEKRFGDY